MLDDLDRQLSRVRQEVRRRDKVRDTLARARTETSAAAEARHRLKTKLEKEGADVAKLEGMSFTNLIVTLFGDKDRKLDEEKKDLARAQLRYDEQVSEVDSLSDEVAGLQAELQSIDPDLDARHRLLLERKEDALMRDRGAAARELADLADRIADAAGREKEIDEAVLTGRAALAAMRGVSKQLEKASNWGVVDMMGGGLFTTMIKHGKLDAAKRAATDAGKYLRRFSRELRDVDVRADLRIDVGGLAKFADYFMDGLLFDWVVQSKISRAKDGVNQRVVHVRSILHDLRTRGGEVTRTLSQLEARRTEIIESAADSGRTPE